MIVCKQIGIVLGWCLMAVGESIPEVSPWAQLGAAGILAGILVFVLRDNATARRERAEERAQERAVLTAIHDRWHADSEKLNQTLREMTAHCATVQTRHKE
jgi:hypothetical protein